jgi:multidrug resistance efflux pump
MTEAPSPQAPQGPAAGSLRKDAVGVLLGLEAEARNAPDLDSLRFSIVTLTRQLVTYRQAIILRGKPGHWRVDAVSNAPVLDRNAPFLQWVEKVTAHCCGPDSENPTGSIILSPANVPQDLANDWASFALPDVVWIPLKVPNGPLLGGLWLSREGSWGEAECQILARVAETYAHAYYALELKHHRHHGALSRLLPRLWGRTGNDKPRTWRDKAIPWIAAALVCGIAVIPVTQSALAPVEVVAIKPQVIAAPIDGVIRAFSVQPNQPVTAGTVLFTFEDEPLRAERDIAAKSLALAQAQRMKAAQSAFSDAASKADLALHDATVALRQAELDHAQARLDRTVVRAERDGVVVFSDVNEWIGRPVSVGERVMMLADPNKVELKADLAVSDAIDLHPGSPMRAFLDAAPLSPLSAEIHQVSYQAQMSDKSVLSFTIRGRLLDDQDQRPRLGLKGTAKVEGDRVPLILYLMRRPLTALRQMTGL